MSNKYSEEFKNTTIKLVLEQGYSRRAAAKAMGVASSCVSKWVQAEQQSRESTSTTSEQTQIRMLEKRVQELELDIKLLKAVIS